jgi:Zn finger protein HypA/HybF involved in hydrogenase expression
MYLKVIKMASTKKYNLIKIRKKKCEQCKNVYEMLTVKSRTKCPKCGSRKVHYVNGRTH